MRVIIPPLSYVLSAIEESSGASGDTPAEIIASAVRCRETAFPLSASCAAVSKRCSERWFSAMVYQSAAELPLSLNSDMLSDTVAISVPPIAPVNIVSAKLLIFVSTAASASIGKAANKKAKKSVTMNFTLCSMFFCHAQNK